MIWTIIIAFFLCSLSFVFGLMFGSALTRNKIYEEREEEERRVTRFKAGGHKFVILLLLLIPLASCIPSATPEPQVIERSCVLVDLQPKPDLPAISWVQGGECSFYRCLDKQSYEALRRRDAMLRADSLYTREVYEGAKERCR